MKKLLTICAFAFVLGSCGMDVTCVYPDAGAGNPPNTCAEADLYLKSIRVDCQPSQFLDDCDQLHDESVAVGLNCPIRYSAWIDCLMALRERSTCSHCEKVLGKLYACLN